MLVSFLFLDKEDGEGAEEEEDAGYYEHACLGVVAATFQEQASAEGSHNLGQADGAVEEPEEGTHLAAAFDGVGEEGEG